MTRDFASLKGFRPMWQPYLPYLLAALLCGMAIALIAREVNTALALAASDTIDGVPVAMEASAASVASTEERRAVPDTYAMIALHLFGRQPPAPIVVEEAIEEPLPETTLQLQLVGVFTHTVTDQASAIIAAAEGQGKTYRVGDAIDTNTQLHAVTQDSVILKTAGVKEQLFFAHAKRPERSHAQAVEMARTSSSGKTRRGDQAVMTATSHAPPQTNQQIRDRMESQLSRLREQFPALSLEEAIVAAGNSGA